jgi:hypothetical protein
MKRVELTHAEVITFYNSNEVLKKVDIPDKGTIMNFQVRTRVNDRNEESPFIFVKCSYYADSAEKVKAVEGVIKNGNRLDIKGFEDIRNYVNKKGEKCYYNQLSVKEITPLVINESNNDDVDDEDLPF